MSATFFLLPVPCKRYRAEVKSFILELLYAKIKPGATHKNMQNASLGEEIVAEMTDFYFFG